MNSYSQCRSAISRLTAAWRRKPAKSGANMAHSNIASASPKTTTSSSAFGVPFPKQMKTKAGETVIFSWIVYKSRAHRDRVNAKVMKDPRLCEGMDPKNMPFDCKRMVYGCFDELVEA